MPNKILTHEQMDFLKAFVPGHWFKDTIAEFRRQFPESKATDVQIQSQLYRNRILSGMDYKIQKGMRVSRATEFKKGCISHNKGQPMPAHVYAAAKATMFKKGQVPPNTMNIGDLRALGNATIPGAAKYFYVKTGNGKKPSRLQWQPLGVLIWEAVHHTSMPKGSCIIHINGDSLDDRPENLEVITRGENATLTRLGVHAFNDREELKTGLLAVHLSSKAWAIRKKTMKHRKGVTTNGTKQNDEHPKSAY